LSASRELEVAPPVLMHYMPWFEFNDRCDKKYKCQHWKMKKKWEDLEASNRVAAHYTPLIGPYDSADKKVIKYHLKLMQAAGVRGIVINWYGTSNIYDFPRNRIASDAIVDVATEVGMKFTVCYEDWTTIPGTEPAPTHKEALAQLAKDFEYLKEKYMTKPEFLNEKSDGSGRPFVMVFGPRKINNPTDWNSMLLATFPNVKTRPKLISLYSKSFNGDGEFSWVPLNNKLKDGQTTTLGFVHSYLKDFYRHKKEDTLNIGTILPGYHDYYVEGSNGSKGSYGHLPEFGGHTFEASMYQAKSNMPNFVQAATWNDFQEGTVFEPAVEREDEYGNPYYFLMKLQTHIKGYANKQEFVEIYEEYKMSTSTRI